MKLIIKTKDFLLSRRNMELPPSKNPWVKKK